MIAIRTTILAYVQRARPAGHVPRLIVIHDPGMTPVQATAVARFNATPPSDRRPQGTGGYHVEVDGQTIVTSAPDTNRVNGAAGTMVNGDEINDIGLHICFCDFTDSALDNGASVIRHWLDTWRIPLAMLGAPNVLRSSGIVSHAAIEQAIHATGAHVDPVNFPWVKLIERLRPIPPKDVVPVEYDPGYDLPPIVSAMKAPGGGSYLLGNDGGVFGFPITVPFKGSPHGQPLSPGEKWSKIRPPNPKDPKDPKTNTKGEPVTYVVLTSFDDRYGY